MDSTSPRERLYEVFADAEGDVETKVDRALEIGADYFDLPVGFFTRVEDGRQGIVCAVGDHHLIQPGGTCPLEEAYCRRTLDSEGVLAVQDVSVSSIPQRAVDVFGLGTYIGAKVLVGEEVYGTVCFAAEETRDRPFSETQELFLELLANLIGGALERRAHEREIEARNERLRREKRRFEGIAENSFDILFRVDPAAEFTYVSSAVEPILGYGADELTGESFSEFLTPSSASVALSAFADLLDGEEREGLELEFNTADGEVVALEVNATPVTEGGEVVGVQGVGRDITARKERERELRIKNRAMDEAEVGISIADPHQPDEPLVYVNKGFERITGYDAAAATGRNCRFLQGPATGDEAAAQFREAIEAGESTTVELVNYRRDGTPFWNRVQLNPVFDESGALTHYLGFQSDVTERRRTEKLIQLLNRVLRHNLRNDMNAIGGWATAIREAETEQVRDAGARIERITRELTELSEHARDLERHVRRDRDPERLDPGDVVRAAAAGHREQYPDATFDLAVDTDRSVCAGAELDVAIAELFENAVKHNPAPNPRVDATVRDDGEWIEITVVDDGPGIDELERRVVTAGDETALEHGSGLGLWLVNWIVTQYGGSFQIGPRADGDGTAATIRLPAFDEGESIEAVERGPTVLFR
jgi:PAS domain S-box-containing protein